MSVEGRIAGRIAGVAVLAMVWISAGPLPARAAGKHAAKAPAEAPARPPARLQELTVDGFVSTSLSYNANTPNSRTNQFRVFDFDDNTFKLDVVELVAQVPVVRPRDAGARVDVALGSSIPHASASAGLFRSDAGEAQDIDLQQAFASWIAPVGAGLRLDAGKFVTSMGYEVIEGYDGWNDNATHSFLFGYAIPFTHVGVRASYVCSPRVSGTMMIVNGWDVARDNNRAKSVGAQLALTPVATLKLWLNAMAGPEGSNVEGDSRTLVEAVAAWQASSRFAYALDAFRGTEPHAALGGGDATWTGIAAYARIAVAGGFALSLRGETFDDGDGARTGVAQRLSEFTLSPEVRLTKRALVRADLRMDRSNHEVFEKNAGRSDTQSTALLNVLFSF